MVKFSIYLNRHVFIMKSMHVSVLECRMRITVVGHNDAVCVNGSKSEYPTGDTSLDIHSPGIGSFLPAAVVSKGISLSLYNWKLPGLSSL